MIQVYKILNDIDIVEKDKLFTRAQYTATRGQSFKLHKKRSRLNVRANTFSNRVCFLHMQKAGFLMKWLKRLI